MKETITLEGEVKTLALRKLDDSNVSLNGDVLELEAVAVTRNTEKTGPNDKGLFIEPAGFDISRFAKNARLYLDHGTSVLDVMGRVTQIDVGTRQIRIKADIPEFTDERRAAAREDIQRGIIKALSVGFFIQEGEPVYKSIKRKARDEDGNETGRTVEDSIFIGYRVTKARLLEISIVYQGADEDAMITRIKSVNREPKEDAIPETQWLHADVEPDDDGVVRRHSLKFAEATLMSLVGDAPAKAEPETLAATWKAIPFEATAKAPEDTKWETATQTAKATPETLGTICAFKDSDSYKGAHHLAGGEHAVVWNGVRALMGTLLGARGGFKGIPADVLEQGYAHAAGHYTQFEKTPPAFRQYANEELVALATAGEIIIPGMPVVNVEVEQLAGVEEEQEAPVIEAEVEDEPEDNLAELHGELAAIVAEAAAEDQTPPPPAGIPAAVVDQLLKLDRDRREQRMQAMTALAESLLRAVNQIGPKAQVQLRRMKALQRQTRKVYYEDS